MWVTKKDSYAVSRAAPWKKGRYHAYHNNKTLCGIAIKKHWYYYDAVSINCPKCINIMKQQEEKNE